MSHIVDVQRERDAQVMKEDKGKRAAVTDRDRRGLCLLHLERYLFYCTSQKQIFAELIQDQFLKWFSTKFSTAYVWIHIPLMHDWCTVFHHAVTGSCKNNKDQGETEQLYLPQYLTEAL